MSSRMHHREEEEHHVLPRIQSLYQFTRDTSEALQLTWQGVFGRQSRFQSWTDWEMKEVLVYHGVELRGEHRFLREDLLAICDATFEGRPMPKKIPKPSLEVLEYMEECATIIQLWWIETNAERKRLENLQQIRNDRYLFNEGINPDTRASVEIENTALAVGLGRAATARERNSITRARHDKQWVPPDPETARLYASYNHPRKGGEGGEKYNWRELTTGRHCVIGGCGEQLDLWDEGQVSEFGQFGPGITNYFKFLKWCAWLFGILTILSMPMIVINTFGNGQIEAHQLLDLSLTTIGNLGDRHNISSVRIPGCVLSDDNCQLDKERLAQFYSRLELLMAVVTLVAFLWMRSFEKKEVKNLDKNTVSPADYTIFVHWVPSDTTEQELKAHFAQVTNCPVSAVHLGFNNGDMVRNYIKRGTLVKQRYRTVTRIRYLKHYATVTGYGKDPNWKGHVEGFHLLKKKEKYTREIDQLDAQIQKAAREQSKPLCAYVTFEEEQGVVRALSIYGGSWYRWLFMKKEEKFRNYRLTAIPAPEPSTILWENLQYSRKERIIRQTLVFVFALGIVFLSMWASLLAREYQDEAKQRAGKEFCPHGFFQMPERDQKQAILDNPDITHCYCNQFEYFEQFQKRTYCRDYMWAAVSADAMTLAAGLGVAVINQMLSVIIRKLGVLECHHSLNSRESSTFFRVFLLNFINTGVILLVMNSKAAKKAIGVENLQESEEFSTEWYQTAGLTLMVTMIWNIVGAHALAILKYLKYQRRRKRAIANLEEYENEVCTQEHLNEIFLGPEFYMSTRYAQVLVTFFVCYTYSSGMPLLTPIACVSFVTTYWFDKYMFTNFYRTPPRYNTQIGRTASKLVYWAIVMHLAVAIWMLGNKEIFSSDQVKGTRGNMFAVDDKLTQKHLLGLVILFWTLVAYRIIHTFYHGITHLTSKIINFVTCGGGTNTDKLLSVMNTLRTTYSQAVDRGLIKGLATYNVLHNPKYREAFAITEQFAMRHRHVNSLRYFSGFSNNSSRRHRFRRRNRSGHHTEHTDRSITERGGHEESKIPYVSEDYDDDHDLEDGGSVMELSDYDHDHDHFN